MDTVEVALGSSPSVQGAQGVSDSSADQEARQHGAGGHGASYLYSSSEVLAVQSQSTSNIRKRRSPRMRCLVGGIALAVVVLAAAVAASVVMTSGNNSEKNEVLRAAPAPEPTDDDAAENSIIITEKEERQDGDDEKVSEEEEEEEKSRLMIHKCTMRMVETGMQRHHHYYHARTTPNGSKLPNEGRIEPVPLLPPKIRGIVLVCARGWDTRMIGGVPRLVRMPV